MKLVLGVACVIVGFVIANPFSVLDYRTFVYDFVYNYKVAPVYEGQTGNSYTQFFVALIECVGVPGFVLATTGWIGSCALAFTPHVTRMQKASIALAGAVVLLYYAKFAPFPRLETRFVLPIVPLAMFVPALAVAPPAAHSHGAGCSRDLSGCLQRRMRLRYRRTFQRRSKARCAHLAARQRSGPQRGRSRRLRAFLAKT